MAKRGFSLKKPMTGKDQRTALFGWGAGALVAVGAYLGALQFYPAQPSLPMIASLSTTSQGVDPIMTGSIGSAASQPMPHLPSALQGRLDSITTELAALREAVAAAQAARVSTNRRIADLEDMFSMFTASIDSRPGTAYDQSLPEAIDTEGLAGVGQHIVTPSPGQTPLPTPIPVDGGAVSVSMSPLAIDEDGLGSAGAPGSAEESDANESQTSLSQTPFAIDIGGASSLEAIDMLWTQRNETYADILDGMSPRLLLQQTSEGGLDLRLVAGPIEDAADAALLCAQLVAAGLERCLPAFFDGQQLALR